MLRFLALYSMFLSAFVLFFFIAQNTYELGYIHLNILFYAEKALLATEGEPPRLENIGFVYPPLAFLPFLLIREYLFVSPLVSALTISLFFSFLLKRCQKPVYAILPLILLNPLILFLAVYRFEVLTFYLLLTLSVIMILLHMESGYSLYLFVSGFLLGLCFFLDFRSLFLVPFFALALYMSTGEKNVSYRLALMIVKLSPIMFFAFAWLYLNWIFTGDPLTFIRSPYSFFRSEPIDPSLLSVRGSFFGSLEYTTLKLITYLPITLPYFLLLFSFKRYRLLYLSPAYLVYISPILLVLFSVYFSAFFPAYYYTVLFLLFAISFQASFGVKISKPVILAFIISLASSWILPLTSKEENEKNFLRFLLTGKITGNLEEYRKIARVLREINCERILIDDAGGFPIIVFTGKPKMFYLPYMYEYYTVLSYPQAFANCIVVDKMSPTDKVRMRFSKANMGFLEGYSLIYEGKIYNVFGR
ncbi:MAG: hypothetical protein ABWK04_09295 [Hydrogenobacter sp.]